MQALRDENDVLISIRDNYWCDGKFVRLVSVEGMPAGYNRFLEWMRRNLPTDVVRFSGHGHAVMGRVSRQTICVHFPDLSDEDYLLIRLRWQNA